jgi:anti-sigma regulatory factor (Ser/Thr protein kinase)
MTSVKAARAGKETVMHSHGGASDPNQQGFVHQALIYGSDEEFMDVALPLIEEGLSAGEPTLVAVQDRHVENLRVALGGTPEGLTLHPVEDLHETSARTRDRLARWAVEQTAHGERGHLMAEPPWALAHEAQVRDWARHEAVLNIVFADLPVIFVCPYDAGALPEEVLGHARGTHPEVVDGEGVYRSEAYEDPLDFCRRLDSAIDPRHGETALELEFQLEDLAAVRRVVGSLVEESGLNAQRTEEVVLAVNEIATNAVIHGRPPAMLRVWHAAGEIIVEVADAGEGIEDVLAGQLTPSVGALGGRGLWLARLLCDAVEVRRAAEGCTVTVHIATANGKPALKAV